MKRMAWMMFVPLMAGCRDFISMCTEDRQCVDLELIPGLCVDDGRTGRYCAGRSFACPSTYRWGSEAPRELEGKCVDPAFVIRDGGVGDGPISD